MFCWTVELMVCVCAGVCSLGSKQTKLHDMAECLFNTAVPLTVRSSGNTSIPSSYYNNPMYHQSTPFFTTNATPVQFQDESGRRVNSVVVEIYLQTIVANKKVHQRRYQTDLIHYCKHFNIPLAAAIENLRCKWPLFHVAAGFDWRRILWNQSRTEFTRRFSQFPLQIDRITSKVPSISRFWTICPLLRPADS